MTEPVAYMYQDFEKDKGEIFVQIDEPSPTWDIVTPLYTKEQLHPKVKMAQAEFDELEICLINAQFDYSELKKIIEIVPDMKWFVRSKEPDGEYYYYLLKNNDDPMLDYEPSKNPYKEYMNFGTKEEAERWTNPLTEAVQLPVEGD
ncbi:hypothetical protein [Leuconostoc pseudomesenteroides]|uniref:hypothetical protein n=1 Tax=Leuconostoc pseudomesenteroides TaxID=33968 RepID=UPI00111D8D4C|nr:hypothetical protein [Leuconostoc pseudomesenteroides]TOZ06283.1 hypothetical protein DIS14_05420 [Leuconostoc pseudomesenteroides]